jgi:hypothetical protein
MGKQIQIYLAPQDVIDFELALKSRGAVILRRSSPERRPAISGTARVQTPEATGVDGYIARADDIEHVSLRAVPAQSVWAVDSLRSPVIEFFGCHFDQKTLKRGRLFYDPGFYDAKGTWVEKPKDFEDWAKDIFKLARKMFKKDSKLDAYIGPEAKEWQSKAQVSFVSLSFAPKGSGSESQGPARAIPL